MSDIFDDTGSVRCGSDGVDVNISAIRYYFASMVG
jgi:hypothetical protein